MAADVATLGDRFSDGDGGPMSARDPVRRVVLTVLALYLMPAVVAVLLVGAVGMVVCAVVRALGSLIGTVARHPRPARRVESGGPALGTPHFTERQARNRSVMR